MNLFKYHSLFVSLFFAPFCTVSSADSSVPVAIESSVIESSVIESSAIDFKQALVVGMLRNENLKEVSGIAASHLNKGVLWVLNDSGNKAAIFAINSLGDDLGEIRVQSTQNNDWEDLASFKLDGISYLVVGDIGDNLAIRTESVLYIVKEPRLVGERYTDNLIISPTAKIRFQFEGGARDCKGLAVDTHEQKIYLVSKSDVPPIVYELPLFVDMTKSNLLYMAKVSSNLAKLPRSNLGDIISSFGKSYFNDQPTAMDISKDGLNAIVLTNNKLFYYRKQGYQDWGSVFANQIPLGISIENLDDAEAATFSEGGSSLFVTTENRPAPLIRIDQSRP